VGAGPLGRAGAAVEPDAPDVDPQAIEALEDHLVERSRAEEAVEIASGDQVEELGPVQVSPRRPLEPLAPR
jgi:hypothetical protein